MLVEEGGEVPAALAEAFDDALGPPYRVVARRVGEARWAAGATRIALVRMRGPDGDEVDVSRVGAEWTGPYLPELDALLPGDGAVHAERLDDDLWEVQVARL